MAKASGDIWQQITSYEALSAAWAKVDANEGSAGGDGVTRQEFRADRFARVNQLRADLLSGDYTPRPYRKVSIPKKKPGYRILTIPSLRDRVLHTSIATALVPILEPEFEESSFAYRPGRGVAQAAARIEQWRNRGYTYVIEADIVSYFDNINHEMLLEKLEPIIAPLPGAESVLRLIRQLLFDQAKALGTNALGLVQGSPLSPLLANLFLDALDEEIEASGVKIVRFADDFVILCKSQKKAGKALRHCVEILGNHGLSLHQDGTRIVNFDQGFDFIGYLFLKSLSLKHNAPSTTAASRKPVKSEVTDEGVIQLSDAGSRFDQGHRVLYVLDPEHRLTTRNKSFSVLREDGAEMIAIAYKRVGRIEIGPRVSFDHLAVRLSMESGTLMAVLDGFGQTKGSIEPRLPKRGGLHLAQAKAVLSQPFRTEIARRLVESRIRNQRAQLSRLNRRQRLQAVNEASEQMKSYLAKVSAKTTAPEMMGLEGAASAVYWSALGQLWEESPDGFQRQRPAGDPLNASINYLTGILERDIRAAVQASSLHPGFAFLHGIRDRHDGLVFDMMEPFRAPLTEGLPVFLFNANRLKADMFIMTEHDEVEMSAIARTALIEGYETAVTKRVNKPDGKGKLGWRALMRWQCQKLATAVQVDEPSTFLPHLMEV